MGINQAVAAQLADPAARAVLDPLYAAKPVTDALGKFRAALAIRETRPVIVVGAGSSTTAGSQATAPAKRYLNLLSGKVQAAYGRADGATNTVLALSQAVVSPPAGHGVYFVNAGVGGTTAVDYLTDATATQVAALGPTMIIHMVGSNDFKNGVPVAAYKATVLARIAYLKARITGPCVHVLAQAYERYDTPIAATDPWSAYGKALAEIAAADPANVAYVDISPTYYQVGIPSSDPLGLMGADKIHQIDGGHALMAELMREALGVPLVTPPTFVAPTLAAFTSDTFTGGDAVTITGRSSDAALGGTAKPWQGSSVNPCLAIVSGALQRGSNTGTQFNAVAMTQTDQSVSAKFTALPSTTEVYLVARREALAVNTSYRAKIASTGAVVLSKTVTATDTPLGVSFTIVAGDTVEVRCIGAVIGIYKNGTLQGEVTDSAVPGPGFAGFAVGSTTTGFQIDDIVIKQVA